MAQRKTQSAARSKSGSFFRTSRYYEHSQRPFAALLFLTPLLIAYEIGTRIYATDYATGVSHTIHARALLVRMFDWVGATGYYLPAALVVAILLAWHIVRKDAWSFEPRLYAAMGVEVIALAIPLLLLAVVWRGGHAQPGELSWQTEMVLSVGAGIYEELVFRLMAIAAIHFLLVDVLGAAFEKGAIVAVFVSAAMFSGYHFTGGMPFRLPDAAFYFLAGIYFAMIYESRGFGIVVGAHAMYDIFVVAISHGFWPAR